jgi:altronate dehydratase large subunit
MEFLGYPRKNGKIGVRNLLLVLSSIVCANEVGKRIERKVPSAVLATHPFGCGLLGQDHEQFQRTLIGRLMRVTLHGK